MAGFTGLEWAPGQLHHSLTTRTSDMRASDAGTYAVSKSLHYGLCLTFEGIRFFVKEDAGRLYAVFVSLDHNLRRFRDGIAFNLSDSQQDIVPSRDDLLQVFLEYLGHPSLREFVTGMALSSAQGYLRPFTIDDMQSIGVTFPTEPAIRVVGARYESYLGEPFTGVSVPWLVRAVGVNGTGCLKLGGNYLLSIKAVQAAQKVRPGAASALFLDDRPHDPLRDRLISEWDTSCCLIAFKDGSVARIPDGPLILPSVTVRGIAAILRREGVDVQERDVSYGELIDRSRAGEIVTVCSIGTAGVLNRCSSLMLLDNGANQLGMAESDPSHELFDVIGKARETYWDIYQEKAEPAEGMELGIYDLGPAA